MKQNIQSIILSLLNEKDYIRMPDITPRVGGEAKDIRSIQRSLNKLIQKGCVQAHLHARARYYTLVTMPLITIRNDPTIQSLQVAEKSSHTRKPILYNPDFLRAYQPNQTFYLPKVLRSELQAIGTVEPIVRPAGTYARRILNRLLIDLSWNSSRLEGNTYSLLETQRLIEFGENAIGKNITEAQMILNHKDAIEYIIEGAEEQNISAHEIYSIHALLSNNLLSDSRASGRIRDIAVGISGTSYRPLDNPHLLKECLNIFLQKLNLIEDPFEQSFFSMVHLSYLQLFEDVNKRTARLVANIPLIKHNLRPLSFIDIEQQDYVNALIDVYEKNNLILLQNLYSWAYRRSSQRYSGVQHSLGEPDLFKIKYRNEIQQIIRTIILEKITGSYVVSTIKFLTERLLLTPPEFEQLFKIVETEIISLHEGNIARFKIRPSEFDEWKKLQ